MDKTTKRKKVKSWTGYAILNRFGDPWSHKVFQTVAKAEECMDEFKDSFPVPMDMSRHKVIRVRITPTP